MAEAEVNQFPAIESHQCLRATGSYQHYGVTSNISLDHVLFMRVSYTLCSLSQPAKFPV
jgi:hypothetical protein